MPNNDHPYEHKQAQSILENALCDACGNAWASHEEITLVAQSGIKALPEADRDRVLRAIAANVDGAAAAFDLANIPENEFAFELNNGNSSTSQELSRQGPPASYRLAMPTWGLAASVMLVSGIGLLLESGTNPHSEDILTPNTAHTTQSQSLDTQLDPVEADQRLGMDFLIPVFLVALISTLALTSVIWKRSRNTTR